MKKFLVSLLALLLLLSVCSGALAWNLEGTVFPLAEPVTFTLLTSGFRYGDLDDLVKNPDWISLCEATNVNFNFVNIGAYDSAEARDNLQLRLLNGEYGDGVICVYLNTLTVADIDELAAAKMLVPLTEYINDPAVMPNLYKYVTTLHPELLFNVKSVDGEIYYLTRFTQIDAYTSGEAMLKVNTAWLEKWNEKAGTTGAPQTLAEFEDMLQYFRDGDLNNNGAKDEVPYFITQSTYNGCASLEHAFGMYGVATKDSAVDMNIMIGDDQQVFFAHTTDMYKEALKTFSRWYKEGYVWEEVFTANSETTNNVMANAPTRVGLINSCDIITGFEAILPPAIEGYTARYHMHPKARTAAGQPYVVISDKCKNPEVLASFIDLLYNYENYTLWLYGCDAEKMGAISYDADGKIVYSTSYDRTGYPAPLFNYLDCTFLRTNEVFDEYVDIDSYFAGSISTVRGWYLYDDAGIWNPTGNIWPRCSILPEYADDYAFMYTDVAQLVAEYRAKFITGEYDVDEKWDEFQQKLQDRGIAEMRDIIQKSYDAYKNK